MSVREPIGTIAHEVTHMLGDAMRRFEIQILPGENAPGRSVSCNPCPFSAGDGDIQIKSENSGNDDTSATNSFALPCTSSKM